MTKKVETLPVEFKFAPLKDFEWWKDFDDGSKQLIGQYLVGDGNNTYNCVKMVAHEPLREKCKEWLADGKIRIIHLAPGQKFIVTKTEVPVE